MSFNPFILPLVLCRTSSYPIDHHYHNEVSNAQGQYAPAEQQHTSGYAHASASASLPAVGASYRPHSPAGTAFSPNYKPGYGAQVDTSANLPARNNSIVSSVTSPNDYSSSWSSTSPTMSHPGTRNNSIYSLDGHMGHVSLGSQFDSQRFNAPVNHIDRRFSLDERARPLPSAGAGPSLLPSRAAHTTGGNGRHWPWGSSNNANSGSAQPLGRASYDYGYTAPGRQLPSSAYPSNFDGLGNFPDAAGRLRSMSSSAASGRYGMEGPLGAASGMAMSHYGSHGDLMSSMDSHGSSSGIVGPQMGPGGGVTRRAKFKRSRTGCLICRKRKVKCSQDGTPCKQCRIGKRDCYYEDNPPKRKRKGKTDGKDGQLRTLKPANGSFDTRVAPATGTALYAPPGPSSHGVSFHMPFGGSHDAAINAASSHYPGPAPHEDAHTPTFGSAGWPVPPGAAHHRDSLSEHPSYDSSLDSSASATPAAAAYGHRASFDAGSSNAGTVALNHDREQHVAAPVASNNAPHGLGHVMHHTPSTQAQPPALWYSNGSHNDQSRMAYAGEASTVQG